MNMDIAYWYRKAYTLFSDKRWLTFVKVKNKTQGCYCHIIDCLLQWQHHKRMCFWFTFLLMHLGRQQRFQVPGTLLPTYRTRTSWLLTLTWPRPRTYCGLLGNESVNGRFILCLALLPRLYNLTYSKVRGMVKYNMGLHLWCIYPK